jgi:transposase
VIPEKADRAAHRKKRRQSGRRPVSYDADDAEMYRERNTVERYINQIKAWRGLAMRSDMRSDSYLAGLQLRGSILWIRSLKPGT